MSILKSRIHIINQEDSVIPTKGLIKSWKVESKSIPELYFGKTHVNIPRKDLHLFDFSEIRDYIRNIDIPQTEEETHLLSLEASFFGYQISAFQFYKSLTDKEFDNSLFTRDISTISIKTEDEGDVNIVEEYYDRSGEQETIRMLDL